MPQISKVRIVNFTYNDGKRLIADELFDFEAKDKGPLDVLINLENGGGKSVLVQLMMQPVIPRAKVAGRRIESFFKKATDHCFVVLEWRLENSPVRLMTGIAMAASDSGAERDDERGFQVKYYTFLSAYQDYQGEFNITHLPLSKKEDRSFVPASFDTVRALASKSGGRLVRFSSDNNREWEERLAQYGIVQGEWRLIEKLNAGEDGLSKYFGDMKTSDAVIDKLILRSIEDKQHHSASKEDSSLKTMLISHARQYANMQGTIRERDLCKGFLTVLEEMQAHASKLFDSGNELSKSIEHLFAYSDALEREIHGQEEALERIKSEQSELESAITHIRWEQASAAYYECKTALENAQESFQTAENEKSEAEERRKSADKKARLIACAGYYQSLREIESRIDAISREIHRRESDSESGRELAILKYSALTAINAALEQAVPDRDRLQAEFDDGTALLDSIAKELSALSGKITTTATEKGRAEGELNGLTERDDNTVISLGIETVRKIDGTFTDSELTAWQEKTQRQERKTVSEIEKLTSVIASLEARREQIPQETAEVRNQIYDLRRALEDVRRQLGEFKTAEAEMVSICDKYSLPHSFLFTDGVSSYLTEQISHLEASIQDETRKIEATEEEITAADRGTLHIPKLVSDFLDRTGISYISVEKYLLSQQSGGQLSGDKAVELLTGFPYAAYAIIVDEKDIEELEQEAADSWLPAVLPVITAEQLDRLLNGDADSFSAIASFSRDYFLDSVTFSDKLKNELDRQKSRRSQLSERRGEMQKALAAAESFSKYDEKWLERTQKAESETENQISAKESAVQMLERELEEIKQSVSDRRGEADSLNQTLRQIHERLTSFENLMKNLTIEEEYRTALAEKSNELRTLEQTARLREREKRQQEERNHELSGKLTETERIISALNQELTDVADAEEAEIVSGNWQSLTQRYRALLSAQNEKLEQLTKERDDLKKQQSEKKREIEKRKCLPEEYEALYYSEESEIEAEREKASAEASCKKAEMACLTCNRELGKAESDFNSSVKSLEAFGGEPLSANEVGSAFSERIANAEKKLREAKERGETVSSKRVKYIRARDRAENAAEKYDRPANVNIIELAEDYTAQLKELKQHISEMEKEVFDGERLTERLLNTANTEYGAGSADIAAAVSGMRSLLSDKTVRGDRYYSLYEHINANIDITAKRISQIETDLKEFDKTKDDLIRQCFIQGKQLYEGLVQLSDNSKVRIQDKRRPMIKFDNMDQINESAANAAIAAEIEKGTKEIADMLVSPDRKESETDKAAEKIVGSRSLLRKYIGIEKITMRAYKIDRNPDNSGYRTWEQTQVNSSGAEKFVVYFAVILALMAYTRDEFDALDNGKSNGVLVLDNPFGPISSRHVLEPMFAISKHYRIQMICLTDINKSDIVSCFDLVIRAVVKRFALSSREQLTHEGNEQVEHGFYQSDQLKLS